MVVHLVICGNSSMAYEMFLILNCLLVLLRSEEDRGWQAMPVLLRNCPHLETLVLQGLLHYVTDKCGDACDCVSQEKKGRSITSCPVKKLEIQGFRGKMEEIAFLEVPYEFEGDEDLCCR